MQTSDWIASASLAISVVALVVAWFGIVRANKTTSAATLVSLNEGFRQSWQRFVATLDDAKKDNVQLDALAELLNLLEIACAIYLEKSLSGNSRKLMFEYLDSSLKILVKSQQASEQVYLLIQSKTTFIYIKKFLRKKPALSVTIPPKWYESHLE